MDVGRFRPAETTVEAVRASMVALFNAQTAAAQRLEGLQAEQADQKAAGQHALAGEKAGEIAAVQRELREFDAIGEQLDAMLLQAKRAEAGRAAMEKVAEAQDAIERYNIWFARNYEKHARPIAEGIELERTALEHIQALQNFSEAMAALPEISKTYVGNEARSLSALCRLPAAQPGSPIYWGH